MKSLKQTVNEAVAKVSSSSSSNDLIIQLNLSQVDEETLDAIYNDSSVDWSKLKEADLMKLYELIGSDLSFDEWRDTNDF